MTNHKRNNLWYKEFFKKFYLDVYRDIFPHLQTKNEVDFIIKNLKISKGSKVLDLCGGYGRIGIPLAKRDCEVSIQDLNKDFLKRAKKEAERQKTDIKIIHSDMRKIPFKNKFDAVINIFTSFGYLEDDKEDNRVLKSINKSLKPRGKFLIDILNGNWLKNNYQPRTWRKSNDILVLEENTLDRKTNRNISKITILDLKKCKSFSTIIKLRIYEFNELKNILSNNGFKIIKRYGGLNGERFFPKLSKRIVVIAKKI